MKSIFEILLKRSGLLVILILTISLMGLYTFLTIENREIPEVEVNIVNITTPWPGADRADVETNITNVIEGIRYQISTEETKKLLIYNKKASA